MGQDFANEDPACAVIDLCNQPITVPFDVKNRELLYAISRREGEPHFIERSPVRLLCDAKPDVQGLPKIAMFTSNSYELLSANYMHVTWKIHHRESNSAAAGYNGQQSCAVCSLSA